MQRFTLLLTMAVTYDIPNDADGELIGELVDNLLAVPTLAMQDGLLTRDLNAEVVVANPQVQII